MRVPTEFWIKAYVRRMTGAGAFVAVARRGEHEFGTVWIKLNRLDGTATLFGPAPEALDGDTSPERRFMRMHKALIVPDAEAEAMLSRAKNFDTDAWIVEIEDRAGQHGLDDALIAMDE